MSQLSADQAIQRFKENENRVDVFANDPDDIGFYQTNETVSRQVESLPHFMARVIARYLVLNSKGDWQTATNYIQNDLITQGGIVYIALADHTSGTFATDLTANKWAVFQGLTESELALSSGASLMGFIQDGPAAVPRTMQDKARDTFTDADAGVTGTGDETAALAAYLDYCVENGIQVVLTKNSYTVSGNILPSLSRTGIRTLSIHCQKPVNIIVDPASTGFEYFMYLNTTEENNVILTGAPLTFNGNGKCATFLRADNNGADNTGIVDIQTKLVIKNLKNNNAYSTSDNCGMLFLGAYKRVSINAPEVDNVERTNASAGACSAISVSGFTGSVDIYSPVISRVKTPGAADADGIKIFGKAIGGILTNKRAGVATIHGGVFTDNQGRHIKSQCSETTIINPISIRQNVITIIQSADFDFQCGNGLLLEPVYIYKKNGSVSPLGASHSPVVFQQTIQDEQTSSKSIGGKMITEVSMPRYCTSVHSANSKESTSRVEGLRVLPYNGFVTSAFTSGLMNFNASTVEAKSYKTTLEVINCKGPFPTYAIGYDSYGGSSLASKLNIIVRDNENTLVGGTIYAPFRNTSGLPIRNLQSFLFSNNQGYQAFYTDLDFSINTLQPGCVVVVDLSSCTVTNGPGWTASGYATFHCVNEYFGIGKSVWAIKGNADTANTMYWTQNGGTTWGQVK